jgi:hypothetical protein
MSSMEFAFITHVHRLLQLVDSEEPNREVVSWKKWHPAWFSCAKYI